MNTKTVATLIALASVSALSSGAFAAPAITGVGVDAVTQADWRTTTVSKPYTVGSNTIYGTDGYVTLATGPVLTDTTVVGVATGEVFTGNAATTLANSFAVNSVPSFVTLAAVEGDTGWSWYRSGNPGGDLDDPSLTPGPSVDNINLGVAFRNFDATSGVDLFTMTFGALTPSSLRVGILHDGTTQSWSTATLTSGAASATVTPTGWTNNDHVLRYVFFDIQNAANETVTFSITGPDSNNYGFGGLSFDVVPIPEPSTWAFLAGGFVMLIFIRRARRARRVG